MEIIWTFTQIVLFVFESFRSFFLYFDPFIADSPALLIRFFESVKDVACKQQDIICTKVILYIYALRQCSMREQFFFSQYLHVDFCYKYVYITTM